MTRQETPFASHGELIIVDGRVTGPRGTTTARLVLDTGASYTTITPEVAGNIGYDVRDSTRKLAPARRWGASRGMYSR